MESEDTLISKPSDHVVKHNAQTLYNNNTKVPLTDMKYDSGKAMANILFEDFPHALSAVVDVGTFGANKYVRNSWVTVTNGEQRYKDAMIRHQLAIGKGEVYDPESKLLHYAHFVWNALATLELMLRKGTSVNDAQLGFPFALPQTVFDIDPIGR
jgi:hypothetical protein